MQPFKGKRQLVQAALNIRRFVEVDAQGKTHLIPTGGSQGALPEIAEVGTKEEQVSQTAGSSAPSNISKKLKKHRELPNTERQDASLVALGPRTNEWLRLACWKEERRLIVIYKRILS